MGNLLTKKEKILSCVVCLVTVIVLRFLLCGIIIVAGGVAKW